MALDFSGIKESDHLRLLKVLLLVIKSCMRIFIFLNAIRLANGLQFNSSRIHQEYLHILLCHLGI